MNSYLIGTCEFMCPEAERRLRTKERLLHFYEVPDKNKPNAGKLVTCFSRSAAGIKSPQKSDLRTFEAMKTTINYLISEILQDPRKPYHHRYDFIFDRLRALRKEMVIQQFDETKTICLLEPIIMFLAYSSYRLCNESLQNYDPKICHQHLQECLKKILCCYDATSKSQNNRAQIEAIYLLFNLGRADALLRAVCRKKTINLNIYNVALEIALDYWQLNFYRCFKKSSKLPPMLLAIFSLKFQEMRRHTLMTFSHAYNNKTLTVDIASLKSILHYTNRDLKKVTEALQYYNLQVVDNVQVKFEKQRFDVTKATMQPDSEDCVDILFKHLNIVELILNDKLVSMSH